MQLSIKKTKNDISVQRSDDINPHHQRSKMLMAITAVFLGLFALAVYSPTVGATGNFVHWLGSVSAMNVIVGLSVITVIGIGTASVYKLE